MSENQQNRSAFSTVAGLAIAGAAAWYFLAGGVEHQVAKDAVEQYEIAKRGGAAMDACVHAGLVAAAFLQAKNEASYQQWKQTERDDCARAGVPVQ